MNTEIIRGNALQVIELVEEVTRLTNELGYAQYDKDTKDKRITDLEKEKEELSKRCERLNADSMAYCNYGKEIEKKKNKEIERLTANLADTQSALLQHRIMLEEAKRFVDSEKKANMENVDKWITKWSIADDEISRLRGLLARNGIKYKKVK